MKIINYLSFLILLFALSASLQGEVHRGEIILKNGFTIDARMFVIEDDVVRYMVEDDSTKTVLDKELIDIVIIDEGSYAFTGFLVGAGLGASNILLSSSGGGADGINWPATFTVTGLGMVIGSIIKKTKKLSFDENGEIYLLSSINAMPIVNAPRLNIISYSFKF